MHQPHAFEALVEKAPAAQALALKLVTPTDLLRLKAIARLHARGLPAQIGWSDLLQEAFARVLEGSRRQPEGLPMVAFLAGVMRSIKAEYWRRARREAAHAQNLPAQLDAREAHAAELCDPAPSPERCLIALQEMAVIDRLFADDLLARQIICGLFEGQSSEEICSRFDMSRTDYESTRKRMRRGLLREGLRSSPP
jgi:DNA-directed RNA polymerase specialized sigma24 family protein